MRSGPIDRMMRGIVEDVAGSLPGTSPRTFWIGLIIAVLSVFSGLATYLILTGLTPITPSNKIVLGVLLVNVGLILLMTAVLFWQGAGLWSAWRAKSPGARLHIRIVALFTLITALPAILLAIAATTTFSSALDSWFSRRTQTIIANSVNVAQAYVAEHGQVIRNDIVIMTKDLDETLRKQGASMELLRQQALSQAGLRELSAAAILDRQGRVVIDVLRDPSIVFQQPSASTMQQAASGSVPLALPEDSHRIAAIKQLAPGSDYFLYVARRVNPKVVQHLNRTEAAVAEYSLLKRSRGGLKLAHALMYLMISLTSVLAAIWVGMWFASKLVAPVRRLIAAAQEVSRGNLAVALPLRRGEGDLRRLSQTFNNMTADLKRQQDDLLSANSQLTERRQFMEAVLSGVTSGVLGLDGQNRISIANVAAQRLLGMEEASMIDRPLVEVAPPFAPLLEDEAGAKSRTVDQIVMTIGDDERTFAAKLTREEAGQGAHGAVVTFDDVTDLLTAQRTAAWADVARRIAHEIKNPLTPIQLSAERLKRKYAKVIETDREVFDKCTDTIIRQVGDVSRMVDEFSSFARMPKPEMSRQDLREAVRDPVFLFQMSHADIKFDMSLPPEPVVMLIDQRLISQALTNLVKNATEGVAAAREAAGPDAAYKGAISVKMQRNEADVVIEIIDNGIGLPRQNRSRLLEPYVTTRAKGTGLGLAIVNKVIEQHGGTLSLEDAPAVAEGGSGAMIRIVLPISASTAATPQQAAKPAVAVTA